MKAPQPICLVAAPRDWHAAAVPFPMGSTFYRVNIMDTVPGDATSVDPYRVTIGFANQQFSATTPLIELVATPEQLVFRARFGLGRFMVPWRVERAEVAKVFRAPGLMSDCIAIQGNHYLDWTIYTFHPEPILLTLEELGYPVDWIYRS